MNTKEPRIVVDGDPEKSTRLRSTLTTPEEQPGRYVFRVRVGFWGGFKEGW